MKTATQVQSDMIGLLQGSALASSVSGKVYRKGYRPRNSGKEDIVVIFTTGMPGQIETGIVTIHVYVPDVDLDGVMVMDGNRVGTLEALAQEWVDSLDCARSDYRFRQQLTIRADEDNVNHEHYIVIMLYFRILNN